MGIGTVLRSRKAFRPASRGEAALSGCYLRIGVLVLAAAIATSVPMRTPAQDTTQPSTPATQEETPTAPKGLRVRVEVVNVPVSVLNKRGLPVIDLTRDNFQVYEDGVLQNIKYFNRETQQPLRIGIVLDTSNSARRQLSFEKDAASEFLYNMLRGGSKNQAFLQTFDATSSIVQDFTPDADLLNEKIQELKSGGGKALYDAIYFACREKMMKAGRPEETRRVLLVISDGLDVQSQHTLDEAVSMARRAETMIYTISIAAYGYSNPGDKLLELLAHDTGGAPSFPLRYAPGADLGTGYLSHGQIGETSQNKGLGAETGAFSAERMVRIADSLESIGHELNEQYELGYTPTRTALDGTYRSIKVVVDRRGASLRCKPGYFAAAE